VPDQCQQASAAIDLTPATQAVPDDDQTLPLDAPPASRCVLPSAASWCPCSSRSLWVVRYFIPRRGQTDEVEYRRPRRCGPTITVRRRRL